MLINFYEETNKPVPLLSIRRESVNKYGISEGEVSWILKKLNINGEISMEGFQRFKPKFSREDIDENKLEKGKEKVNLVKIKNCIEHFFKTHKRYPKPREIKEKFQKIYGTPNIENFNRYIRRLAEKNKLERIQVINGDFLYRPKNFRERTGGLKNFL